MGCARFFSALPHYDPHAVVDQYDWMAVRAKQLAKESVGVGIAIATSSSPATKSKAAAGSQVKAESIKDTCQPKRSGDGGASSRDQPPVPPSQTKTAPAKQAKSATTAVSQRQATGHKSS